MTSALALETGGTSDPSIVNSLGYTGLIQIGSVATDDINRRKGTSVTLQQARMVVLKICPNLNNYIYRILSRAI